MLLSKIIQIVQAQTDHNYKDLYIKELIIDSRRISNSENAMFIALTGSHRNGHDFIQSAYDSGIRHFMIQEEVKESVYKDALFIMVKNTLKSLQDIAIHQRKQCNYPVIGITGSNGKTIVKEWLFQLLNNIAPYNSDAGIVRSPKSYNSQIGVPLSVYQMKPDNTLGIFEAGISQPDEMQIAAKIIQPSIGIFTNIGEAHSEGFLSIRQKINEKLKLFSNAEHLIYCKDYADIHEQVIQFKQNIHSNRDEPTLQCFTWSKNSDANLRIININKENSNTKIEAEYTPAEDQTVQRIYISLPYIDDAYIENAIHCWATLLLLNINQDVIEQHMAQLLPVKMRLEIRKGINNSTIINDTYNSDITSLKIALDLLSQQKQHLFKTVIISDLLQLGQSDETLYGEVLRLVAEKNIQRIICIGPNIGKYKSLFRAQPKLRSIFFKNTEQFIKKIHFITFKNEAILIKGARSFKFEKIEKLLEQKIHKTILEVNLSSIEHNLNVYKKHINASTQLMVMVKADSYGNGSFEIANILQFSGVDYLTVAYTDEGIALRKAGITLPILVMSPEPGAFDQMISWKLEPEIFNLYSLNEFLNIAKAANVEHYPIHIKLDTGMHRLGFEQNDIEPFLALIKNNDRIKIKTIFSHLAASEDANEKAFTLQQAKRFDTMSSQIIQQLNYKPLRHLANSASIINYPEFHFDMVRLGIGLYGFDTHPEISHQLQIVSTLKTTIAQIKHLQKGDTVGYNRAGKIESDKTIATVSIGYADGYRRDFGLGNAYMLVNKQKAKVVGKVCMDMCMLDITEIENVKEGDEVIVFGPELSPALLAQWADTISYEILTNISERVKRIYVND